MKTAFKFRLGDRDYLFQLDKESVVLFSSEKKLFRERTYGIEIQTGSVIRTISNIDKQSADTLNDALIARIMLLNEQPAISELA